MIWPLDPRSTRSIKGRLRALTPFIFQRFKARNTCLLSLQEVKIVVPSQVLHSCALNPQPDPAYSGDSVVFLLHKGLSEDPHAPFLLCLWSLWAALYSHGAVSLPICIAPAVPCVRLWLRPTSGKLWRTSWVVRHVAKVLCTPTCPVTSGQPTLLLKATVN